MYVLPTAPRERGSAEMPFKDECWCRRLVGELFVRPSPISEVVGKASVPSPTAGRGNRGDPGFYQGLRGIGAHPCPIAQGKSERSIRGKERRHLPFKPLIPTFALISPGGGTIQCLTHSIVGAPGSNLSLRGSRCYWLLGVVVGDGVEAGAD